MHSSKPPISLRDFRRVDFGYFIRPGEETPTGRPRTEPLLGYLLQRDGGSILFDTGMGLGPPELEAHYQPVRHDLRQALEAAGTHIDDVRWVINCHLHFDHCGGNPLLARCPIFVQAIELAAARSTDYTLPEVVDFNQARYEELSGEAEPWPGVHIIPTPGHTPGHQSMVVACGDGTVIAAGQPPDAGPEAWIDLLMKFDPARIFFAHDQSVLEPPALAAKGPKTTP